VHTQLSTAEGAAEPLDALAPGAKAGPWVVDRELGRGGMGSVYGVVHEEIGKRAALKVMHRRLISPASAERTLLEARVVNQVGHPNIVDIFETGELPDGRPYIVMERLDGISLGQHATETRILPDRAIAILLEVCDALIAAHAAGVVHRDLKLDNVFLLDNADDPATPHVKVLDWGIAKVMSHDHGPRNTIEGQLVGTPQYLAPEQARGGAVSHKTDVYSLGVMAYELFVEQLPFEAETSAEIMAMHLRATPPPPSDLWPDIPPVLERLLLTMLAKTPDTRPSMLEVARTLEHVRDELMRRRVQAVVEPQPELPRCTRWASAPALAPTQPVTWRARARRWQFVVGALALAAGAVMFVLTHDSESAPVPAAPAPARAVAVVAAPPPPPASASAPHVELAAVTVAPAPLKLAPAAPAQIVKHKHHSHAQSRGKPHRDQPIDPDGTLEPYR
jgi:serine/threonine-protein kinase